LELYNNELIDLFSLGELYLSDFLKKEETSEFKEQLALKMDPQTGLVLLDNVTNPKRLYGKYWYRSGINKTMINELKAISNSCIQSIKTSENDVFLDIACNDGTLLKFVPSSFIKVGVDPADDSYLKESSYIADLVIQDFFTSDIYKNSKYGEKKAKIITTIAMFYDLADPLAFLNDINEVLDDEGLFVLQMSYTPLMLKQLAFDNICHEHVFYYNLTSLISLLDKVEMRVVDCQLNDTNGGSFRVYVQKNKSKISSFRTSPYRDVANFRIQSILAYEENLEIKSAKPYLDFYEKICQLKDQTFDFVQKEKKKGKSIWGYGASTKGNTLLQWFNFNETLIDGIAERSPYKYDLKTVGTNIPIFPEDEMRKVNPDYLLILPWHFIHEFKEREKTYLNNGGKFIVPCPKFEIV